MNKRILSVLIMSALALSITACGENEKSLKSKDSVEVTTTTNTREDDVPETTTTEKEDDISEATTTATSSTTEAEDKNEMPVELEVEEETIPEKVEVSLPDGPVNPTLRTSYTVTYEDYENFANGSCTLEELCANSSETYDEAIEYTAQGYTTTSRVEDVTTGQFTDIIFTYNNKGEKVHQKVTFFDGQSSEGFLIVDADYVQEHFKEGYFVDGVYSLLNSTSDEKIASFIDSDISIDDHNCARSNSNTITAVVHENNCTIIYDPTTISVNNSEYSTTLRSNYFEMITYNSDGRIESISYSLNNLRNGVDINGNSHTTIQSYVNSIIGEDTSVIDPKNNFLEDSRAYYKAVMIGDNNGLICEKKWTYDKNGNLLSVKSSAGVTFYLYE